MVRRGDFILAIIMRSDSSIHHVDPKVPGYLLRACSFLSSVTKLRLVDLQNVLQTALFGK